jgi:hypothetical protein
MKMDEIVNLRYDLLQFPGRARSISRIGSLLDLLDHHYSCNAVDACSLEDERMSR